MVEGISEELIIMANLQNIRATRPWIDCEFALYQKLVRNREAILDLRLVQIKEAARSLRDTRSNIV